MADIEKALAELRKTAIGYAMAQEKYEAEWDRQSAANKNDGTLDEVTSIACDHLHNCRHAMEGAATALYRALREPELTVVPPVEVPL